MVNSLHAAFGAIANVRNEQELKLALKDTVGQHFGVQRWGIYLLDDQSTAEIDAQSIPAVCLESNPVGRYVVERHAPRPRTTNLIPSRLERYLPPF